MVFWVKVQVRVLRKWCLEVAGARPGGLVATRLWGQTELLPGFSQVQGSVVNNNQKDRRLQEGDGETKLWICCVGM